MVTIPADQFIAIVMALITTSWLCLFLIWANIRIRRKLNKKIRSQVRRRMATDFEMVP